MKAIAFKSRKDGFDWILVDGTDRNVAAVVMRKKVTTPKDNREAQLLWVAQEVAELVKFHTPIRAAIQRVAGGNLSDSLVSRIEVDGVIRAALGKAKLDTTAIKSRYIAKAFGVKINEFAELEANLPCLRDIPGTFRDLALLALSQLPDEVSE
ncbi:hypothetical protein HH308_23995 [Gordonia sp. TBRC 11910]|uniref:Uncharacterized protein n=1 Tax=Gordonia asplenii TaxID=2725283 RepID=A0A848L0E1_9ACTN|nr:hypothetical protein [Gordonia asplenii]NMO04286.1 hypothetical protein [Gordonia asplenii]